MTQLLKIIRRVTRTGLGPRHGRDRGRPLVVSFLPGDVLSLRPLGTRREPKLLQLENLYDYAIRCEANRSQLEKAREKKKVTAERRERARLNRATRALFTDAY